MSLQLDRSRAGAILKGAGWWGLFIVCLTFGAFALWMGGLEVLYLAGFEETAKERAVPAAFIIHALAGGVALIAGPLQFNQRLRKGSRRLHRFIGRVYVGAVWLASIAGFWSALFFAVDIPARVLFGIVAILWFTATTLAFSHIRRGRVALHREWMIRSFALSLFFVAFQPWVTGLESTGLANAVAYPLGVFLSWSVNLIVAEVWIRRSRTPSERRPEPALSHPRVQTYAAR